MAEWLKAAVLKTVVLRGTGGSNPPCSVRKGARVAESGSLLRSCSPKGFRGFESPSLRIIGEMSEWSKVHDWKSCMPKGIGGSNPPLSARMVEGVSQNFKTF